MIVIQNVSKGNVYSSNISDYELRINKTIVAKFKHKREDGLAKCLIAAAAAFEKSKWVQFIKTFNVPKEEFKELKKS